MYPELHTTDSQVSNWGQSQKDNFHEKGKLGLRFTHVNRSLEFFSKLINSKSCNLTRLPKSFLNPSLCCRLRSSFFARGKLQIEIFTAKLEKYQQYQKSFQLPGVRETLSVSDASLQLFISKSPIPYLSPSSNKFPAALTSLPWSPENDTVTQISARACSPLCREGMHDQQLLSPLFKRPVKPIQTFPLH